MKKLLSIALSLCLLLSVALADVTLTKVYKTEDLVSNTFHNGFVTAIGMTGENTVVLKDDGTYEYTKRLMKTAEDGTVVADLVYTFTGTYTKDGDTVVGITSGGRDHKLAAKISQAVRNVLHV